MHQTDWTVVNGRSFLPENAACAIRKIIVRKIYKIFSYLKVIYKNIGNYIHNIGTIGIGTLSSASSTGF